jgi:hypothetical protein
MNPFHGFWWKKKYIYRSRYTVFPFLIDVTSGYICMLGLIWKRRKYPKILVCIGLSVISHIYLTLAWPKERKFCWVLTRQKKKMEFTVERFIHSSVHISLRLFACTSRLSASPFYLSISLLLSIYLCYTIINRCVWIIHIYGHVRERDYGRDLDWWLDLLTTYTHDSWLRFTVYCYTHTSVLSLLHSPLVVA